MPQAQKTSGKGSRRDARNSAIFGEVLRAFRTQKGLTQEELAIEGEMDRAYVSELERGLKEPCLSTILKLADILNVPVADIMSQVETQVRTTR